VHVRVHVRVHTVFAWFFENNVLFANQAAPTVSRKSELSGPAISRKRSGQPSRRDFRPNNPRVDAAAVRSTGSVPNRPRGPPGKIIVTRLSLFVRVTDERNVRRTGRQRALCVPVISDAFKNVTAISLSFRTVTGRKQSSRFRSSARHGRFPAIFGQSIIARLRHVPRYVRLRRNKHGAPVETVSGSSRNVQIEHRAAPFGRITSCGYRPAANGQPSRGSSGSRQPTVRFVFPFGPNIIVFGGACVRTPQLRVHHSSRRRNPLD